MLDVSLPLRSGDVGAEAVQDPVGAQVPGSAHGATLKTPRRQLPHTHIAGCVGVGWCPCSEQKFKAQGFSEDDLKRVLRYVRNEVRLRTLPLNLPASAPNVVLPGSWAANAFVVVLFAVCQAPIVCHVNLDRNLQHFLKARSLFAAVAHLFRCSLRAQDTNYRNTFEINGQNSGRVAWEDR
jgi:hypothetical protein